MLRVELIKHLARSPAAAAMATRGSLSLQERGFIAWPCHSWDGPAVAVFDGAACVGVICYQESEPTGTVEVDLAHTDKAAPRALLLMLRALRRMYAASAFQMIEFTAHVGNGDMAKIGKSLGLAPISQRYRLSLPPQHVEQTVTDSWVVDAETVCAQTVDGGESRANEGAGSDGARC